MEERYSLNEQTLQFIFDLGQRVELGKEFTTQELVNLFEASSYNKEQFDTYIKPKNGSIWYAVYRSKNWKRVKRGTYSRI
jgi:hypothetical protein